MPATTLAALAAEPDPTDRLADAGAMPVTVDKAACWAELSDEVRDVLNAAAWVVDRYGHGFAAADDDLDYLAAALAAFVTTTRERARAARRNAA